MEVRRRGRMIGRSCSAVRHYRQIVRLESVLAQLRSSADTDEREMNVVSILAHADDEMRCLGTMLKCRARGDQLTFVTVTDGSKGFVQNPGITRAEAASIRESELRALATGLDAGLINIGEL